ncbi:MAG: hypothetical protein LBD22_00785 [Spirochaetaceae bacterium]|jgi:hypothetical protein|nr:hypothetical protein [Spirochaetaceae bacterium]
MMKKNGKKINKGYVACLCGALVLMAVVGACHAAGYFDGYGDNTGGNGGADSTTVPYLDSLELQATGGGIIAFDKPFDPGTNMYSVRYASVPNPSYTVVATSLNFNVTYVTGTVLSPATDTYAIVSVENGKLKNDYIISVNKDGLPEAKLKSLTFSDGYFVSPSWSFDPDITGYEIEVPEGIDTILASGVPEVAAGKVVYSEAPVSVGSGKPLIIQVAAPGHNIGVYTILVQRANPMPSFLDGLELSAGSLSPKFSRNITNYTITLHSSTPLTVLGRVAYGTVSYSQGTALANGGQQINTPSGVVTLTANYGIANIKVVSGDKERYVRRAHTPKDYLFTIVIDDTAKYTNLDEIKVNGVSGARAQDEAWILYQRNGGNRTGKEGFEADVLTYELYFTSYYPGEKAADITAYALSVEGFLSSANNLRWKLEYNKGNPMYNPTVAALFQTDDDKTRYSNFIDPQIPMQITVKERDGINEGALPRVYHIFISYNNANWPYAVLTDILVNGEGTGANTLQNTDSPGQGFLSLNFNYSLGVRRGANLILKGIPEKESVIVDEQVTDSDGNTTGEMVTHAVRGYDIRYDPENSFANVQNGGTVKIWVNGGIGYREAEYTIEIEVFEPMNPELQTISVRGNELGVITKNYRYVEVLEYEGEEFMQLPFEWAPVVPEGIKTIRYAYEVVAGSTHWIDDPEHDGFDAGSSFVAEKGKAYIVYIEVTCNDGEQVTYTVQLKRQGQTDKSIVLTMIQLNNVDITGFNKDIQSYVINITNSNDNTLKGIIDPNVGVVLYSYDEVNWQNTDPIESLLPGETRTIIIRADASGKYNDYTVTLSRSTALYKVDAVSVSKDDAGNELGTYQLSPSTSITTGVVAGTLMYLVVTPVNNQYKIATKPVVQITGTSQRESVVGVVPGGSNQSSFSFSMPAGDVTITLYFENILSQSNQLVVLTASDGSKMPIMEVFDGAKSDKTWYVGTKNTKVDFSITGPVGAEISYKELFSDYTAGLSENPIPLNKDDEFSLASLYAGLMRPILITVRPDNTDLEIREYLVIVMRLPNNGVSNFAFSGSTVNWVPPIPGWYKVELWGGAGGQAWADTDLTANHNRWNNDTQGGGGYTCVEGAFKENYFFKIKVGGRGQKAAGRKEDDKTFSVTFPDGGKGGKNRHFVDQYQGACGGGGSFLFFGYNGGNDFEAVAVAGGGGGGSSKGKDGPTNGGAGGGGNPWRSAGEYALNRQQADQKDDTSGFTQTTHTGDANKTANFVGRDGHEKGQGGGGGGYYVGSNWGQGGQGWARMPADLGGRSQYDGPVFTKVSGKRNQKLKASGEVRITWMGAVDPAATP